MHNAMTDDEFKKIFYQLTPENQQFILQVIEMMNDNPEAAVQYARTRIPDLNN